LIHSLTVTLSRITLSKHGKIGPKRTQRRVGSFRAVDRFGHAHHIEIFSVMTAGQTEVEQSLVTDEGETVDRISKGLYRIAHGGIDLVSNDRAAP
jgi:hypothetical protein